MAPGTKSPLNGGAMVNGGLTRRNLESHTKAARSCEARRRGRSTPSPEPDFHDVSRTPSEQPKMGPITEKFRLRIEQFKKSFGADWIAEQAKKKAEAAKEDEAAEEAEAAEKADAQPPAHAPASMAVLGKSVPDSPKTGQDEADAERSASKPRTGPAQVFFDMAPNHTSEDQQAERLQLVGGPEAQVDGGPGLRATRPEPRFPAGFPAYRVTQNLNEVAAYLANASYFVSVGGKPLADIKYGIIAIPVGEESLLFGRNQPSRAMDHQALLDAIDDANRAYDRELRAMDLHDQDEDSSEFVRHRFDDDAFSEPSLRNFRAVEVSPPPKGADQEKTDTDKVDRDQQAPPSKRRRISPEGEAASAEAKEQEVAKDLSDEAAPAQAATTRRKGARKAAAATPGRTAKAKADRGRGKAAVAPDLETPNPQKTAETRNSLRKRVPAAAAGPTRASPRMAAKRTRGGG